MKPFPVLQLPEDLPPAMALALFEYFSAITDRIWQQYDAELIALILEEFDQPSAQMELDFYDDIEF